MSKTGTYKYDKETGELVKISDSIPHVCVFDVHVPEGGYYSQNLQTFVESRKHKRKLLKERGLKEIGEGWKNHKVSPRTSPYPTPNL